MPSPNHRHPKPKDLFRQSRHRRHTSAPVGVVQDITERRRAEDTLRESEERFRAFFHNVTVGTAQLDLAGKFIEVNDTFCDITGYSRKEILSGMTVDHLIHPDDRGPQWENLKKYLGGELPFYTAENRYITKDGSVIWVHVTVGMIRDAYGNPRYSAGVIQNITKRKQLEEELRRTHDELELRIAERTSEVSNALETLARERHRLYEVLETIPAMVCLMTLDHRIIFSNRAFRERFGTPNTQECCYAYCFGLTEPCDFCQSFKVFETKEPYRWEMTGPDGSIIDVHDFPFRDADGTPLVLEMGFDVTEQRRIESERVYLEEQLRQSQKMQAIGTLAGGIAHDFNNMLAVIIGNAELLLDDIETGGGDGTYQVGQILRASKRARDLVKQILTFSRRSDRQKKPLKIVPIIKETVQLLRGSLPSTIHMEMTGITDVDTILADPSQVQQILMNLATNAAYAMRENGGKLTVSYAKRIFIEGDLTPDSVMGPGEYFELTIDDTGIGMAPEIQKRIFEPFFTTKAPGEGTGMGLAVVFGIAQTLRGTVTVKSKVGKGSTFTVFLPICSEASEDESEVSSFPGGNESILVVDDEPSVLEVVAAALKQLGYRVTMARDGSEGFAKFRDHPDAFDLVVTDHVMPDLTGVRLAQKILQIREDMPIILFSGYSETISPEKARSLGIKEFLMKPIMKRQLAETVRKVLDS